MIFSTETIAALHYLVSNAAFSWNEPQHVSSGILTSWFPYNEQPRCARRQIAYASLAVVIGERGVAPHNTKNTEETDAPGPLVLMIFS